MAFDFRQLRRGLTKYLDYDIKKNALDREITRRTQEKADEAERKLKLESDEAQQKALLDLSKLQSPAGIEAQSRLLPGLDRSKSEQFLQAKTFLSPLLREKQYGQASKLGVGEFGATEEDTAKIEAEKALADVRKRQADLATAKIGKVQMDIRKVQGDIKKQDKLLEKGADGSAKKLKELYNVYSDEVELFQEKLKATSENLDLDQAQVQNINEQIRQEIAGLENRKQWILGKMKEFHIKTLASEGVDAREPIPLPENVRSNIGPLTRSGKFQATARPKLDY